MAFYRAKRASGGGGSLTGYSLSDKDVATASTSKTISNKNGKILLLFVFMYAQSADIPYNRYNTITVSGGTATQITTLMDSNARVAGTFFKLKITSNTCTITSSNNMRIIAFEGDVS